MKVVILAGGLGTRLSEETELRPKPMVEIGGRPILWHIMKIYSHYGFNEFIICLGYKGYMIKEYFANYFLHEADVTIDLSNNSIEVHEKKAEPWKVTLLDTGHDTMTGGRIKRVSSYVAGETFMLTYGDGVGNIDIPSLVSFHRRHGHLATLTSVQPTGRFGALDISPDCRIDHFIEKPRDEGGGWVNAGFFVLDPSIFRYIDGDATSWERVPLERLAKDGELYAYKHESFWKPMDTLRDRQELEKIWSEGSALWRVWK
jgi:glucose-1-phosphate cytidylyltransferase